MLVKDIMSRTKSTLSPDDNVQKFISMMKKYHVQEVLVLDKKKLLGEVNYKSLAKKNIPDPSKTKIRKVMSSMPPSVSPDTDVDEATELIFNTGVRALPVVEKGVVKGVITSHDVVDAASKTAIFRQTPVKNIMVEPILIKEETEIGKVRVLMREKNISRLPIIDKDGKLKGMVAVYDLLKAVKPKERMGWYSMAAEMDRIMRIPVSTIMDLTPVTIGTKSSLSEVASLMSRKNTTGIVVVDNKIPKGIITTKDLLEVLVSQIKPEGVYYQIVGLTDEDSFVMDTVDRMIRDSIRKISHTYDPEFFFLHVKKHETGLRSKTKYSIRARLRTNKGVFMSKAWKWDLRDAVGDALDNLERIVFKEKDIKRQKRNKRKTRRTR